MHPLSFVFEAIGTRWEIDIPEPSKDAAPLREAILARIEIFDRNYSRFRTDSLVTRMAREAGTYELPADAKPLFDLYEQLYRLTNGAFTPLIGRTLEDAGYDTSYSLKPASIIRPPQPWEEVMRYAFPHLTLIEPALLDFGAAGKGYLVDLIGALLVEHGVESFVIDAGGDILHRGPKSARIGLEDPAEPGKAVGAATIQNQSLCGSAGNRRTWGAFHHTIDPRTLTSPTDILATWAIASTTLLADALTTCLYLVPPQTPAPHFDFHYAVMDASRRMTVSPDAPIELFTE